MSLPYRWYPVGTTTSYYDPPKVGSVVALEHAALRVVSVTYVAESDWEDAERNSVRSYGPKYRPYHIVLRPVSVVGDDARARDHDLHFRAAGVQWDVYPGDHYPVCVQCCEPVPCRDEMARKVASDASKQMDRYSTPGVCPACSEPITQRQKSITFLDNVEVPAGPPVTYHAGRTRCRLSAVKYEQRWAAQDPDARRTTLSCTGHVTTHNDGTYECSQLTDCPGPAAQHPSYRVCRCPDCHARGGFGCHPPADAELLRRDVS